MLKSFFKFIKTIFKGMRKLANKAAESFNDSPIATVLACVGIFFLFNTMAVPVLTYLVASLVIITYVIMVLIVVYAVSKIIL